MRSKPEATVLVISVSAFLADEGPMAFTNEANHSREQLMKATIKRRVREIVFIADHTKHLSSSQSKYGLPLLNDYRQRHKERSRRIRRSLVNRFFTTTRDPTTLIRRDITNRLPNEISVWRGPTSLRVLTVNMKTQLHQLHEKNAAMARRRRRMGGVWPTSDCLDASWCLRFSIAMLAQKTPPDLLIGGVFVYRWRYLLSRW